AVLDPANHLAVAYSDGHQINLWHDLNGSHFAAPAEITTLVGTGSTSYDQCAIISDPTGHLIMAFHNNASPQSIQIWPAANANYVSDAGEVATLTMPGGTSSGRSPFMFFDSTRFAPILSTVDFVPSTAQYVIGIRVQLDWDGDGLCFADDPCPARARLGDMTGDGQVNQADIAPFVAALLNPSNVGRPRCAADFNRAGQVGGVSIAPFAQPIMP